MKPPPKLERFRDFQAPDPAGSRYPSHPLHGVGGGQEAGGDPNCSLTVHHRLAAGEVRHLLGVAVDERRHRIAGDGGHRAVGAVGPTGADAG